jgi:hypothetical protein
MPEAISRANGEVETTSLYAGAFVRLSFESLRLHESYRKYVGQVPFHSFFGGYEFFILCDGNAEVLWVQRIY